MSPTDRCVTTARLVWSKRVLLVSRSNLSLLPLPEPSVECASGANYGTASKRSGIIDNSGEMAK